MNDSRPIPARPTRAVIDLSQLGRNFDLILGDKPPGLKFLSVVKDNAYGHGMLQVAAEAARKGAAYLGVVTVEEGLELRNGGITAPILLFGERTEEEMDVCFDNNLTCTINSTDALAMAQKKAVQRKQRFPIHLKINTGMNRYGIDWSECLPAIRTVLNSESLFLEGIYSHFAMSDEVDKSFARIQIGRFESIVNQVGNEGFHIPLKHMCNSGGFLDLPEAHFDMVRIGILPLGVYPSASCRRVQGINPVLKLVTQIASLRTIQPGEFVGYGLRYKASSPCKIAVLPIGYGDGYPRVRNEGAVLIHGRRMPVVGGVAMDALMVDVTELAQVKVGDEAILVGKCGAEEISIHDLAALKKSVSYDAMTSIRSRIPRIFVSEL